MELIYSICICVGMMVLAGELIYVVGRKASKFQNLLMGMTIAVLITYIGALFELQADKKAMALLGVKMSYFGKPFIILCIFVFGMEFCGKAIKPRYLQLLMILHSIPCLLVLNCENSDLFYTSIDYVDVGGFQHLVFERGTAYIFYNEVLVVVYILISGYFLIKSSKKRTSRQERKQFLSIIIMYGVCILGFVPVAMEWIVGFDTTLLCYLVAVNMIRRILYRYHFIDTVLLAKERAMEEYADGLVVLDENKQYRYSNKKAKEIFPDLYLQDAAGVVEQFDQSIKDQKPFFDRGQVYSVRRHSIKQNNVVCGYSYQISNTTDNYNYSTRLEYDVANKTRQIKQIQQQVIFSFATMIEARDGVTGQHIKNTKEYVRIVANSLATFPEYQGILTPEYIEILIDVAPLHDVGKIAVPDRILQKEGKLTDEEYDEIKQHTTKGAAIVKDIMNGVENNLYVKIGTEVAHYHHEKWNGKGYPVGLAGEKIPLSARIMAIADVYDAFRAKRSYKEGFSAEKSRNIILEERGNHFDPIVVDAFMKVIGEIESVANG